MKGNTHKNYKTSFLHQLFFLGLLCVSSISYGQVDIPQRSIEIKGEEPNEVKSPVTIAPKEADLSKITSGTLSIKSKVKLGDPFSAKEKREVYFMEGNDFQKKEYKSLEKKMNKQLASKADIKLSPDSYKDQNLGNFKSGSKFVNFVYRDHQYVDGDRVSVAINDTIVHPNIYLQGDYQGFYMDLKKGFNKIDIKALNQGTSGPNTAQFIMYDDQRQVISSNVWNLATGVTATVIIIKD